MSIKQVTWVRIRDWHILTSGLLTYTADARFRVKHAADAFEWTLEIKYLQKRDEGTYYCQVTSSRNVNRFSRGEAKRVDERQVMESCRQPA